MSAVLSLLSRTVVHLDDDEDRVDVAGPAAGVMTSQ